jgi:hypothetical protein
MALFSKSEVKELRAALASAPDGGPFDRKTLSRLLDHAEQAIDANDLLATLEKFPCEPYSQANELVKLITDGTNELWNKYHY